MSANSFPTTPHEWELLKAAEEGDCKKIEQCLRLGANIDLVQGMESYTPLLIAATNGHTEAVAMLLKYGANMEHCSLFGKTALMLATQKGHEKTVALLLHYGADPSAVSSFGHTALTCLERLGRTPQAQTIKTLLLDNIKERTPTPQQSNSEQTLIKFREKNHCQQPFIHNDDIVFVYTTYTNESNHIDAIDRLTFRCHENILSHHIVHSLSVKLHSNQKCKLFVAAHPLSCHPQ